MSIDINQKLEAIAALEASQSFPKQTIYFQILRYLVHKENEDVVIKSTTIAIDLLSSKDEKSKNLRDSYVRSKMYNLRKELELFYANEGKSYPVKISIPKGAYKVVFSASSNDEKENKSPKIKLHYLSYISSVILLFLCIILFYLYQNKKSSTTPTKRSFVSYFLSQEEPLDIALGDRSFYQEYDLEMGRNRFIYDTDVTLANNIVQFNKIVKEYPERKIIDGKNFHHIDIENMFFANQLSIEWTYHQQSSVLYRASQIHTIHKNTLFLSKTYSGDLYDFSSYFEKSICNFSNYDIRKSYIQSFTVGDSIYLPKKQKKIPNAGLITTSYCLFKKVIIDNKHSLFILLPSSNQARNYITKYLYDDNLAQDIIASFDSNEINEFEILLEVSGNKMKGVHHKVVYNSAGNVLTGK